MCVLALHNLSASWERRTLRVGCHTLRCAAPAAALQMDLELPRVALAEVVAWTRSIEAEGLPFAGVAAVQQLKTIASLIG